MSRPTTRLGRALAWWANNDEANVPARYIGVLAPLLEPWLPDDPEEGSQLNAAGRRAMREHGFTGSNGAGWRRGR